jgi:hypothetical protein
LKQTLISYSTAILDDENNKGYMKQIEQTVNLNESYKLVLNSLAYSVGCVDKKGTPNVAAVVKDLTSKNRSTNSLKKLGIVIDDFVSNKKMSAATEIAIHAMSTTLKSMDEYLRLHPKFSQMIEDDYGNVFSRVSNNAALMPLHLLLLVFERYHKSKDAIELSSVRDDFVKQEKEGFDACLEEVEGEVLSAKGDLEESGFGEESLVNRLGLIVSNKALTSSHSNYLNIAPGLLQDSTLTRVDKLGKLGEGEEGGWYEIILSIAFNEVEGDGIEMSECIELISFLASQLFNETGVSSITSRCKFDFGGWISHVMVYLKNSSVSNTKAFNLGWDYKKISIEILNVLIKHGGAANSFFDDGSNVDCIFKLTAQSFTLYKAGEDGSSLILLITLWKTLCAAHSDNCFKYIMSWCRSVLTYGNDRDIKLLVVDLLGCVMSNVKNGNRKECHEGYVKYSESVDKNLVTLKYGMARTPGEILKNTKLAKEQAEFSYAPESNDFLCFECEDWDKVCDVLKGFKEYYGCVDVITEILWKEDSNDELNHAMSILVNVTRVNRQLSHSFINYSKFPVNDTVTYKLPYDGVGCKCMGFDVLCGIFYSSDCSVHSDVVENSARCITMMLSEGMYEVFCDGKKSDVEGDIVLSRYSESIKDRKEVDESIKWGNERFIYWSGSGDLEVLCKRLIEISSSNTDCSKRTILFLLGYLLITVEGFVSRFVDGANKDNKEEYDRDDWRVKVIQAVIGMLDTDDDNSIVVSWGTKILSLMCHNNGVADGKRTEFVWNVGVAPGLRNNLTAIIAGGTRGKFSSNVLKNVGELCRLLSEHGSMYLHPVTVINVTDRVVLQELIHVVVNSGTLLRKEIFDNVEGSVKERILGQIKSWCDVVVRGYKPAMEKLPAFEKCCEDVLN